jgi:iron complex outermembrane receptor protein
MTNAAFKKHKFLGAKLFATCASAAALLSLSAVGAAAQTAVAASSTKATNTDTIETVIVTATKRKESIQHIPFAITAVGGDTLQDFGATNFEDYARLVPSVQFSTRGVGDAAIIIRGINSSGGEANTGGGASTVGLYYDEAVITGGSSQNGGGRSPNIQAHDIERLEVLEGPQGTLFGASSMSGTVRIITNKPDLENFSASTTVSGAGVDGGNDLVEADAMVNIPLVQDELGLRAVAWTSQGGGYIDHEIAGTTEKNDNDEHLTGGRATLLWSPTADFKLTLMALRQHTTVPDDQAYDGNTGPYIATVPTREPYADDKEILSLVGEYDLGYGTITGSSSYYDSGITSRYDTSGLLDAYGFGGIGSYGLHQTKTIYSNELRFASNFEGPFQIVGGVFYEHDNNFSNIAVVYGDPATGNIPCDFYESCLASGDGADLVYARNVSSDSDQYAGFAQGDYKLTDDITLTAGLRYFTSQIKNVEYTTLGFFGTPGLPAVETLDLDTNQSKLTYNVSARWEPTSDFTLYGRIASGFRPGGINAASYAAQFGISVPATFGPDSLTDYEVGVKTVLLEDKLFLDAAVYTMDWKDMQVPGAANGTVGFITNAAGARVNGAELSLTATPLEGVSLHGSVTYTDASLTKDIPDGSGLDGDSIPNVAHWSYAGTAKYERPIEQNMSAYIQTNFSYTGPSKTQFDSTNPYDLAIGNYFLIGAAVGIRRDNWDLQVFAKNLGNVVPLVDSDYELGLKEYYTVPPRTIGVKISTSF